MMQRPHSVCALCNFVAGTEYWARIGLQSQAANCRPMLRCHSTVKAQHTLEGSYKAVILVLFLDQHELIQARNAAVPSLQRPRKHTCRLLRSRCAPALQRLGAPLTLDSLACMHTSGAIRFYLRFSMQRVDASQYCTWRKLNRRSLLSWKTQHARRWAG